MIMNKRFFVSLVTVLSLLGYALVPALASDKDSFTLDEELRFYLKNGVTSPGFFNLIKNKVRDFEDSKKMPGTKLEILCLGRALNIHWTYNLNQALVNQIIALGLESDQDVQRQLELPTNVN